MIIVRILGGLGNQLFQYAYAKSLADKGYHVKIDISAFKNDKLHGGYHLGQFKIDLETSSSTEIFLQNIFLISLKKKKLCFSKRLF